MEFGIIDISIRIASFYCPVTKISEKIGVDVNKLTTGLGLCDATVCGPNEDAVSLGMTAVLNLLQKNNIDISNVGRMEIGTESNFDGSKSFKTYFMDIFGENNNVCGIDNTNACYGGTAAVLNCICWLESKQWDGRYAIAVCADTAFYEDLNLMPLAGSAGVAILCGPKPSIKINSVRHFFKNTFDFCKPRENYPFPVINGKDSVMIYTECFQRLIKFFDKFEHVCMHTPYPRLPEKACVSVGIDTVKLSDSLIWPRKIGNSYTGSSWIALASLMANGDVKNGDGILFYSFGSGATSSMILFEKCGASFNDYKIFDDRIEIDFEQFSKLVKGLNLKEMVCKDANINYSGYYIVDFIQGGRIYEYRNLKKQ